MKGAPTKGCDESAGSAYVMAEYRTNDYVFRTECLSYNARFYNQFAFLNLTYSQVQMPTMMATTAGYPKVDRSSGM